MIYISHDIAVIAEVSDRIGVMYAGRMAELADAVEIFRHPLHPYTYALLSAFPSIKGPRRVLKTLPGEPPDLLHPPSGCRFHPRCPYATDLCRENQPKYEDLGNDHFVACWHPLEGKCCMKTNDALVRSGRIKKIFPDITGLFRRSNSFIHAVDGVSFAIKKGSHWAWSVNPGAVKRPRGN